MRCSFRWCSAMRGCSGRRGESRTRVDSTAARIFFLPTILPYSFLASSGCAVACGASNEASRILMCLVRLAAFHSATSQNSSSEHHLTLSTLFILKETDKRIIHHSLL